jgi:hypothetical protein
MSLELLMGDEKWTMVNVRKSPEIPSHSDSRVAHKPLAIPHFR